MYRIYFKQAWNLIRQEKLFSLIYIVGTGLSVAMVMVLSIIFYVRIANVYPETNRSRTLVVKSAQIKAKIEGEGSSSSNLSEKLINTCIAPVKGIEALALILDYDGESNLVQPVGTNEQLPITSKFVNTGFWKVYNFRFLEGNPFTEADFQSGIPTTVISESLAKRLFGSAKGVIGKYVSKDFRQYRVCGVVKDGSAVTGISYAQMWIPYTANKMYTDKTDQNAIWNEDGTLGHYKVFILVAPGANMAKIKATVEANAVRYSKTLKKSNLTLMGQPDYWWQSTFRLWSNEGPDFKKLSIQYGLIFLILLMVPAVSLSGMTDSRMERRLAEMGVRRAFGAPMGRLMNQIFAENFLFTFLGGLFGLLLSYIIILLCSSWIMSIGQDFVGLLPDGESTVFTPSMLMNWQVFFIALVICFVLNMLSAMIPAWRAAHRPIVDSINV